MLLYGKIFSSSFIRDVLIYSHTETSLAHASINMGNRLDHASIIYPKYLQALQGAPKSCSPQDWRMG